MSLVAFFVVLTQTLGIASMSGFMLWRKICRLIKQHCFLTWILRDRLHSCHSTSVLRFCLCLLALTPVSLQMSKTRREADFAFCLPWWKHLPLSLFLAPFWRSPNLSGSFSLPPSEGERGRSLTQSEKLQYHNRNKSVHETPQRDRLGREIGVALITRWRPVGTDWVRVSRRCRVAAQIAWCDKSSEDVIEMMVSDGIFSILCLCRRAETDGKQMLRRFVLAQ